MLLMLVVMIFIILLVSVIISGGVSILLSRMNILPPLSEGRLIPFLIYMALVSLLTGTILALLSGKRFLHQINVLAEATKEVAAGNFNVRIKDGNTKEVYIITKSFNEMVKELSNTETLRSDFVSNISHEFKTPIVSIRGFARRLRKDNTLSEGERNEYLDIIISESERLTRLSSNVLLLSNLENTEKVIEKSAFYLDEQLRRAILLIDPQLQKKQLEVDVSIEKVEIIANEEMLSHLWINLLNNAIKFSPDGSTITVTLKQNADNAIVAISDMGIGMDNETKKRIFDKFYQGDKSRAMEGNGLGLSLVQRIVELDNGNIEVDSQPDKGACFTVSIPKK